MAVACEKFQNDKNLHVTDEVDARTWAHAWTAPIAH
jgi:hypothetical protein